MLIMFHGRRFYGFLINEIMNALRWYLLKEFGCIKVQELKAISVGRV